MPGVGGLKKLLCTVAVVAAAGACSSAADAPTAEPEKPPQPARLVAEQPLQLPRGGTRIFPDYRIVTYYGTAGTGALGVLGAVPPAEAADRLDQAAAPFATPDRRVQPAMELIVTIADGAPGDGGKYSHTIDPALAWQYLDAARAHHQMLVLDIQPGRTDFLTATRQWEQLLAQPDVGVALDAEWRMQGGAVPGKQIGQVDAAEINGVTDWLAGVVRNLKLPQKLVVLHQFTDTMITNVGTVAQHPELALVQHVDGFGTPAVKIDKYTALQRAGQFHLGFKVFYTEDVNPLSPKDVLGLNPQPEYISYQ
ncbi:hypothetical protein [Antrihabitans cavernicola]|uniref:Lipoprotein n=1 Tax=Antrihabitans cavernicola TaxID=2495913 RepID=A0A5A7S629_9NOCA|nr:hypothetical protein [Spelaeibacter cavernicola]KAA0021336.1 hypothetical protein FOY51_18995 [Spelaeibacter cavernicola]